MGDDSGVCFFLRGGNLFLTQHRRDGFGLITIARMSVGSLKLYQAKADWIDYISMRFQFWSMPENSRVGIPLKGSSVGVC